MTSRECDDDEPKGEWIGAEYVARRLGLDVRTVKKWIRQKRIGGKYVPPSERTRTGPQGERGRWFVLRAAYVALRK